MLKFTIDAKLPNGRGRAGRIETPHGVIHTPAFIPVGTKATVKSLTPEHVKSLGADAVLANTYHLYLQPGPELLKKAGGIGKFMNWHGPTFTDSGGFQAFSLGAAFNKTASKIGDRGGRDSKPKMTLGREEDAERAPQEALARVTEDGVEFKSVLDGSTHFFTPEKSMEVQHDIGADLIFAFDECTSPHVSYEYQREAMERTHRWAERSLARHKELNAARIEGSSSTSTSISLLGIVQGGRHEDLRKESARVIGGTDFDGFGIGGSFDKEDIGTAVGWVVDELPEGKPRHLLGIGSEVVDLVMGIENGVDTFDCVAPTRIARNGTVYSSASASTINLMNASYRNDFTPIDPECGCYACAHYTKAYIAHLFRAKEMLAATLASIHNLYFVVDLVKRARQAIIDGRWEEFKRSYGVRS